MSSVSTLRSGAPLLVLGSKNYSSWSLRPWLFLRKVGFDFREEIIHFDAADYQMQIARRSPSRRVPLLIDGEARIWDSLAICEYAAECTAQGLPTDRLARARSRSLAAEMHSGFQALRGQCPMNVRARARRVPLTPQLQADIARIDEIWSGCLMEYGSSGGWLFGDFSIADAMFAPVLFRFQTYGAALSPVSERYLSHALSDATVREWQHAAEREGHPLPEADSVGA